MPNPTQGLRHIALSVKHLEECTHFYSTILGMELVWKPDDDNLYFSTGADNLALHRAKDSGEFAVPQRLDHLGFFLATPGDVDEWHAFMVEHGVKIIAKPKDHRDGTRSFYCADPDGNIVQLIYYPASS